MPTSRRTIPKWRSERGKPALLEFARDYSRERKLCCPTILAKRAWPKIRSRRKRAITAQEHAAVIASEKNPARRAYYDLLYETGAAQTDAANLTAEDVDRQNGALVYRRCIL